VFRIRIQLFTSTRIRILIQGAKTVLVLVRLCSHKKLDFVMKNFAIKKSMDPDPDWIRI
jgi:hypothetical protein